MAAEYAQTLAMEQAPPPKEEPPTEDMLNAQAALEDVKIVIPDGMQVRSHKSSKPKEDPDAVIKKLQEEQEKNNFEKLANLDESKSEGNQDGA